MSRTKGSDINSKTFYGCNKASTSKKKEQNINARLERWSTSGPIPETPQYGLLGPSLTWKVFPLQAEALSFAQSNPDLMTFSFESKTLGGDGKRSFLVADPARFFDIFIQRPQSYRTSYEIIPEGRPSKLYFDLEFDKVQNVGSCGITMTKILIKIVIHFLKVEFNIDCTGNDIISLDSSTDRKFSKHLIFNLKNCIFQNNFHVGHFVRNLSSNILSLINDPQEIIMNVSQNEIRSLLVSEKGDRKLFIDLGVYTKNRNFRVYKATKLGKNNPLVLSEDDSSTYRCVSEKQLFLDSLITYTTGEKRLLKCGIQEVDNKRSYSCSNSDRKLSISKCGKSPYEEVDGFISEKIKPGFICKWKFFPTSNHLVYSIENFRFCHNIGREHKSNGIYLVANIQKRVWYQKCHDPDCSGYQSPESPLPDRLFDWIEYSADESILSEFDECVSDFLNDDECFVEENIVRQPKEDTRNEMITDFLNDKECFEETINNNSFCQPIDSRNKEVSDFLNDDAWCTEVDEDVNNMETAHAKPKTDPTFDFMTNNYFEECNFTQMENVQLLEDASAFISDDEFFKDSNKIDQRKTKDDWFADGLEDMNIESTQEIIRKITK